MDRCRPSHKERSHPRRIERYFKPIEARFTVKQADESSVNNL
jgi:hypothetical protein